jgi:hypothetical protein
MRSNELREHVAIEQVATTLTSIADVVEGKESHFDIDTAVKVRAIYDKQRREVDGPLEVGIVYGSAHHKIMHTFEGFKIPVRRIFAAPRIGSFSFVGSNLDTFFGGYVTKPNEEVIEKCARAFVLESVFSAILNYPHVFEAVHVNRQVSSYNYLLAQRLARQYSADQHMYLGVIARLRQDPRLLRDDFIAHGAKLRTT